jgi:amidase
MTTGTSANDGAANDRGAAPGAGDDLCLLPAREQARLLARREVSAVEVMDAHLDRIGRVNPAVNAIVTLDADRARDAAAAADAAFPGANALPPLWGLPIGVKDLVDTGGLRTTYGSPIFADHVPEADALLVRREKAAGGIVLGKTNTPEWGAGSHTFNPVFGVTRNPWHRERTAGGSSGGTAVALATGMLPLADGSDLGGSLRNPAGYNSVVGLRPSPGRVARGPVGRLWDPLPVDGPMGRTVADVALFLSAIAGPDRGDPLSLDEDPAVFRQPLDAETRGLRIGVTEDLGHLAVDPAVRRTFRTALGVFETLGVAVEEAWPDLSDAAAIFPPLRAAGYVAKLGPLAEKHRDKMKDTVLWNLDQGFAQTAMDIGTAEAKHAALYARVMAFFERFDFLVLPVAQIQPFPIDWDWVREIDGTRYDNYLQWMEICWAVSLTGCPAISVPGGFDADGLPLGLQIVAPPRRELDLLRFAHAVEQANGLTSRRPSV